MSDYIVLVKQVPDVTQITDNAFDPVTGTLIRTRLTSVINELDIHALAAAEDQDTRICKKSEIRTPPWRDRYRNPKPQRDSFTSHRAGKS